MKKRFIGIVFGSVVVDRRLRIEMIISDKGIVEAVLIYAVGVTWCF